MAKKKLNLYLDIDGVLNKSEQWSKMYQLNDHNIKTFSEFICMISKKYDVDIILSSTWKNGFVKTGNSENTPQIKELEEKLKKSGLLISAKTPSYKGKTRDVEILSYEKYYESDVAFILDDSPEEFSEQFKKSGVNEGIIIYYTDSRKGFTNEDIAKIKKYL